ncbi:helix-turn-helix domain-containing protein [Lacticigenium naphthae]|uniref:helix-turn-helix domain-containing protein n=1 Tax=Lacticigenium naphthae TaxID=515351 RepID=UPI0004253519|nr:helix-turn-helix domain-containing protein [Lacticigenium naphthae]
MFRRLLSVSEQRHIGLLEELTVKKDLTAENLAAKLACSTRTIKSDLTYFQEKYKDYFNLSANKNNILKLEEKPGKTVSALIQEIYNDNTNVRCIQLLFENEAVSAEQCEDLLHVSSSTLRRSVQQINTVLEPYQLTISLNPCRINGSVLAVRHFFSVYYATLNPGHPYAYDRELAQKSYAFIQTIKKKQKFWLSATVEREAVYFLTISLDHIRKGRTMGAFYAPVSTYPAFRKQLTQLTDELSLTLSTEEEQLLTLYFLRYAPHPEKILVIDSSELHVIYDLMKEYITELRLILTVTLPNEENLLARMVLQGYYRMYFKGDSTFSFAVKRDNILQGMGKWYEEFSTIALSLLEQFPILKKTIAGLEDSYAYWIVIHWNGLAKQLTEKRGQKTILLVSELGLYQERILRDYFHSMVLNKASYRLFANQLFLETEIDLVITDTALEMITKTDLKHLPVFRLNYRQLDETAKQINQWLIEEFIKMD